MNLLPIVDLIQSDPRLTNSNQIYHVNEQSFQSNIQLKQMSLLNFLNFYLIKMNSEIHYVNYQSFKKRLKKCLFFLITENLKIYLNYKVGY